jgi:hypothetical protein
MNKPNIVQFFDSQINEQTNIGQFFGKFLESNNLSV